MGLSILSEGGIRMNGEGETKHMAMSGVVLHHFWWMGQSSGIQTEVQIALA
jgi:hypothetical protein